MAHKAAFQLTFALNKKLAILIEVRDIVKMTKKPLMQNVIWNSHIEYHYHYKCKENTN